ncbi:hypothetical protein [Arthrobacter sp. 31Y]|uniref:hypothetical protein n=1 Tax=Arthrobacter sp. 31Y TaxID=1115632 RepID=UPI0004673AD0|nr:hypothetical protein [Arthrobacter sp. 31Y]
MTAEPRGIWACNPNGLSDGDGEFFYEGHRDGEWITVVTYMGESDGKPVVQLDTGGDVDFRINVNDAPIWDQSAEEKSVADFIKAALADGSNDAMFEAVCNIANLYQIELPEEL